jgi:hypothetical protein
MSGAEQKVIKHQRREGYKMKQQQQKQIYWES